MKRIKIFVLGISILSIIFSFIFLKFIPNQSINSFLIEFNFKNPPILSEKLKELDEKAIIQQTKEPIIVSSWKKRIIISLKNPKANIKKIIDTVSNNIIKETESLKNFKIKVIGKTGKESRVSVLEITGIKIDRVIKELNKFKDELSIFKDREISIQSDENFSPEDPFFEDQWALESIQIKESWKQLSNLKKIIIVAVIDSGIEYNHPDIRNNVTLGYDFVNQDSIPEDLNGHGTHVAGIIAAETNNTGIIGIAPFAKIMPLKVIDRNGKGSLSDLMRAIEYAVNHGADVINISSGFYLKSSEKEYISIINNYLIQAYNKNIPVIASAGNRPLLKDEIILPAFSRYAISVGGYDQELNHLVNYQNYSPDIFAPGKDILSLRCNSTNGPIPRNCNQIKTLGYGDEYGFLSGASQATAHVAGVVGLMKSEESDLTLNSIRNILLKASDNQKLNADKAIALLKDPEETEETDNSEENNAASTGSAADGEDSSGDSENEQSIINTGNTECDPEINNGLVITNNHIIKCMIVKNYKKRDSLFNDPILEEKNLLITSSSAYDTIISYAYSKEFDNVFDNLATAVLRLGQTASIGNVLVSVTKSYTCNLNTGECTGDLINFSWKSCSQSTSNRCDDINGDKILVIDAVAGAATITKLDRWVLIFDASLKRELLGEALYPRDYARVLAILIENSATYTDDYLTQVIEELEKLSGIITEINNAKNRGEIIEALVTGLVDAILEKDYPNLTAQEREELRQEKIEAALAEIAEREYNRIACGGCDGNPVRLSSGIKETMNVDLVIPFGKQNIIIQRKHTVLNRNNFSFGKGWFFNYDSRIIWGVKYGAKKLLEKGEEILANARSRLNEAAELKTSIENYLTEVNSLLAQMNYYKNNTPNALTQAKAIRDSAYTEKLNAASNHIKTETAVNNAILLR